MQYSRFEFEAPDRRVFLDLADLLERSLSSLQRASGKDGAGSKQQSQQAALAASGDHSGGDHCGGAEDGAGDGAGFGVGAEKAVEGRERERERRWQRASGKASSGAGSKRRSQRWRSQRRRVGWRRQPSSMHSGSNSAASPHPSASTCAAIPSMLMAAGLGGGCR